MNALGNTDCKQKNIIRLDTVTKTFKFLSCLNYILNHIHAQTLYHSACPRQRVV